MRKDFGLAKGFIAVVVGCLSLCNFQVHSFSQIGDGCLPDLVRSACSPFDTLPKLDFKISSYQEGYDSSGGSFRNAIESISLPCSSLGSPDPKRGLCRLVASPVSAVRQGRVRLVVLGIAQDGGYPQAGCQRPCCTRAWQDASQRRHVSCLGLIDEATCSRWMFDCTPDFRDQLHLLDKLFPEGAGRPLQGILPTHAHIGHYAGLMQLGREVMGAKRVPVFCMPRMKGFLESEGPWRQLVALQQIAIVRIAAGAEFELGERVKVTAIPVPHRDEFSETVAFRIEGPSRSALYLPDIDKWERWSVSIESVLTETDIAFLDATFFDASELPGRDLSEIPHPLIAESLQRFQELAPEVRNRIHFIHLNHSNPALDPNGAIAKEIEARGFHIARQGESFDL